MNKKATFSCVKDYDEQGEHLGEQPVRRVVPACDLDSFSLGNKKPTFPEQPGVTLSICPDNQYAIFYNNNWRIARYTLYKITTAQAHKAKTDPVQRPNPDPWQQDDTPGKLISVTVLICFFNEEI